MARIHILEENERSILQSSLNVQTVADIVRELVQNSVDASASEIQVTIDNYKNQINISCSDNGCGMDLSDLSNVGKQYYTSKFYRGLNSINTLGFRGQALSSIIRTSTTVCIETSNGISKHSTEFTMGFMNKIQTDAEDIYSSGTKVSIKDVFGLMKSRKLELLRSQRRLKQQIQLSAKLRKYVIWTMAWNPYLCITVAMRDCDRIVPTCRTIIKVDTRRLMYTHKQKITAFITALAQAYKLYKSNPLGQYSFFTSESKDTEIQMAIGINPVPTEENQYIFLNGRPLLDTEIQKSICNILDGSKLKGSRLSSGYWTFVIMINTEYNFSELFQNIDKSCSFSQIVSRIIPLIKKMIPSNIKSRESKTNKISGSYLPELGLEHKSPYFSTVTGLKFTRRQLNHGKSIRVINQVQGRFILCRLEINHKCILLAVDQHACAERIRLEHIYLELAKQVTDLDNVEDFEIEASANVLEEATIFKEALKKWGIVLDTTGDHLTVIKLPEFAIRKLRTKRGKQMISFGIVKYIDDLAICRKREMSDYRSQIPDIWQELIKGMSCKKSIRFGDVLDRDACEHMILQLCECEDPFHCAHGRPTMYPICEL